VAFDFSLFNFIHGFAGLSSVGDWIGILIAEYLPYLVVLFMALLILREKEWKRKVWASLVVFISIIISRGFIVEAIHYWYDRPRPFLALGFDPLFVIPTSAFPSSHAVIFFTLGFIAFVLNRKAGIWFIVFALVNGIARIFSGVHWPSDILGGFGIALVSVWIALRIFPERKFSEPPSDAEEAVQGNG